MSARRSRRRAQALTTARVHPYNGTQAPHGNLLDAACKKNGGLSPLGQRGAGRGDAAGNGIVVYPIGPVFEGWALPPRVRLCDELS
jgi:hypothetical protein